MADQLRDELESARRQAGLTHGELWLRYFQLGGMRTGLEVEAICYGALQPSAHDHDVMAHALNERFVELGGTTRLPTPTKGKRPTKKRLVD
jgi:hypothetical protein